MDWPRTAFAEAPVRADDLRYVVDSIRHGRCCSIVAASNMGKSGLLRSLLTPAVQQACAQAGASPPLVVFVDCLPAGDSEAAFHELLLHRLVWHVQGSGIGTSVLPVLQDLQRETRHSPRDVDSRLLFASSIHEIARSQDVSIVFVLDEFDETFRTLPPWPFRQLRALHDDLAHRLCYVTATWRRLERLRERDDADEFVELFQPNTRLLRPLARDDSGRLIQFVSERQRAPCNDEQAAWIHHLTGGHPGLLSLLCRTLVPDRQPEPAALDRWLSGLANQYALREECRRLWTSLEAEEQEGLRRLVQGRTLTTDQRDALEEKGLVVGGSVQDQRCFSPLLETYLQSALTASPKPGSMPGLHCDPLGDRFWVGERDVTLDLTDLQVRLARVLCQHAGSLCTYRQVEEAVWGTVDCVDRTAISQLVRRLRDRIETEWGQPRCIAAVAGRGYCLQTPS